ncbi:MAG TPA: D-alanyl-D-alanine carboxypeptidase family protein [Candidatus Limnocylindrales bacterium]|nr:D-alanyl-D-alanine carboxypeptidase family protein [Candidatus Limnocylindrales bacterium]
MKSIFTKGLCYILIINYLLLFFHSDLADAAKKRPSSQQEANSQNGNPPPYKSAILMDADTGQILFEYNIHQRLVPASLVKMMVILLVMERIQQGLLNFTDPVTASAWASKIGGHQVYLKEGEVFPVEELLKAVAISSANDAATALAEHIAGSTEAFVQLMNERAKELGMNDTTFANVHGLPAGKGQEENYTSAYDMAILAKELLKHPEVLHWSSTKEDTFRNGTFTLTNTNKLLGVFPGLDGLKTGYTAEAGFNLCATAKRDDLRLISVVMGGSNSRDRFAETTKLLSMGFNTYKKVNLFKKGFTIDKEVTVLKGKTYKVKPVPAQDVGVLIKKGQENLLKTEYANLVDSVEAPVQKGQKVGEIVVKLQDQILTKTDLIIDEDVPVGSFITRFIWWVWEKI